MTPGFWPVLEMLCDDINVPFGKEEPRVLNALKAVEESNLLDAPNVECLALRKFIERLLSEVQWESNSVVSGSGIARAIQMKVDTDSVFSSVRRLASLADSNASAEFNVGDWIGGMTPIAEALESEGLLDRFEGAALIPATQDRMELLVAIAKLDPKTSLQVARMISLTGEVGELVASITPKPTTEWPDQSSQALAGLLLISNPKIELKPVLTALTARFIAEEELTKKELDRIFQCLCQIEQINNKLVETEVKALVENAFVFRRINNCASKVNSETVGHLVRWAVMFHDFGTVPSQPSGAAEGFALAKNIGQNPSDHATIVTLIVSTCRRRSPSRLLGCLLAEVDNVKPLIIEVIKALHSEGSLGETIQGPLFVKRFEELKEVCSSPELTSIENICTEFLNDSKFTESLGDIDLDLAELEGVICLVHCGAALKNSALASKLEGFLVGYPTDSWLKSLQAADSVYKLLATLQASGDRVSLGGNFDQAYEQFLIGILDGSISVPLPPAAWDAVTGAIASNQQDTIARRVIERADAPDRSLVAAIPFFSNQLARAASNHDEESFVRNALIPIVRSKNAIALDWLCRVASASLPSWERAPESDRETFVHELNSACRSSDAETQLVFARLADTMLVKLEGANVSEAT